MALCAVMFLQTLLIVLGLTLVGALEGSDPQEVTARPGEDVTLPCRAPSGYWITQLEWSRTDLKAEDGYVFFYRNKRPQENYQHPSFQGRVKLRDPEMKGGDVSVTLTNVSLKDSGRYECQILISSPERIDIRQLTDLTVNSSDGKILEGTNGAGGKPNGEKPGVYPGLIIGLSVFGALLLVVIVVSLVVYCKGVTWQKSCRHPVEAAHKPH